MDYSKKKMLNDQVIIEKLKSIVKILKETQLSDQISTIIGNMTFREFAN